MSSEGDQQSGGFKRFGGFGGFGKLGESLRQQAEELTTKAASQVSDFNKTMTSPHKEGEELKDNNSNTDAVPSTPKTAGTTETSTPSSGAPKTPDNFSKEELLDVLQKMNRKMKAFSSQRTQLVELLKASEEEKDRLLKLVKEEILSGVVELDEGADTVQQLERAWRTVDERNSLALQQLQNEYKTVAQQCKQEVEEVKKASEAETQARVEEMRAEIAAETLASGNEAWETMREQLTKRHQEEAALLRQQLHEQYDHRLAQQEEGFARRLEEEIEKVRRETEERVKAETTASSGVGEKELEELKAKHASDIDNLKQAAAAQMQAFKKKVAVARTKELEKIKTQYESSASSDSTEQLQEQAKVHEAALEELKARMTEDAKRMVDSERAKVEERQQTEITRVKEELEGLHQQNLDQLRSRLLSSSEAASNDRHAQQQQQHEAELNKVREEAEARILAEVEKSKTETEAALTETMNAKLQEAQTSYEDQIDRLTSSLSEQVAATQKQLQEASDALAKKSAEYDASIAEIDKLKTEHQTTLESLRTTMASEGDASAKAVQEALQQSHAAALEDMKIAMEGDRSRALDEAAARYKEEMSKVIEDHQNEKQKLREDVTTVANQRMAEAEARSTEALRSTEEKLRKKAAEQLDVVKSQLESERSSAIATMKQESSMALAKALEEAHAASAEKVASMQGQFKEKIDKLQQEIRGLSDELNGSKKTESTLRKELEDARTKTASVEDLLAAHKSATKDSTESAGKQMEEALRKQGSSFEERIGVLKEEYSRAVEERDQKLKEVSMARQTLENNLNKASDTIVALQRTLQSNKDEMEVASTNFKAKEERYVEQVAALQNQLNNTAESQQEERTKLQGELRSAKEELARARQDAQGKMKKKDAALAAAQNEARASVADSEKRVAELRDTIEALQTDLATAKSSFKEREENLVKEVQTARQEKERELAAIGERLSGEAGLQESELAKLRAVVDEKKDREIELEELVRAKDEQLAETTKSHESRVSELSKKHEETVEEIMQKLKERESDVESHISRASENQAEIARLNEELSKLRQSLEAARIESEDRVKAISSERDGLVAESSSLKKQLSELHGQVENLTGNHAAELESMKAKAEIERRALSEKSATLEKSLEELQSGNISQQEAAAQEVTRLKEQLKRLEAAFAAAKGDHADALSKMEETVRLEEKDRAIKLVDETRRVADAERSTEVGKLKKEYETKLEDAAKKQATASEFVKKLKAATAKKLQTIEQERSEERQKSEEEKSSLKSELNANFDSQLASLTEKYEEKVASLQTDLQRVGQSAAESDTAKRDQEQQIQQLRSHLEAQVSKLQEERDAAFAKVQDIEKSITASLKGEHEKKLQEAESSKVAMVKEIEERVHSEMQSLHDEKLAEIQRVKEEYDALLAKTLGDNEQAMEKIRVDYEERLQKQGQQHSKEVKELKQTMISHSDELKSHFQGKLQNAQKKLAETKSMAEEQLKAKNAQLEKLVTQLNDSSKQSSSLQDENDALRSKLTSDNVVKQALQKKVDQLQKQMADTASNNDTTTKALMQKQDRLMEEKAALEEKLKAVVADGDATEKLVERLKGNISGLEERISSMLDDKKDTDEKLEAAARKEVKLGTTEKELSSLREQITKLKLDQTKSTSLLEKLQAEKEASERKHGQRTALVGMLEAQLSELNDKNTQANVKLETALYDLSQREEEVEMMKDQLEKAQKSLKQANLDKKKASDSLSSAQKGADAKKAKMVEALQREVQTLQQQMGRKSAAAQRLIQEREAECIELRKANKVLQQEVDKGSLSDRRIFELAAQQSNRESVASAEIEIRDKLVARLSEKLEARDGDLASAEHNIHRVEGQVEELCRVRRREDVNLDYLKSIVVQYLSKPPGSSEREALLPVLATLLQFDANDYKTIEDGKNKLSWWGSVAPVLITPPTPSAVSEEATRLIVAGAPHSAEVSVSSTNSVNGTGRPRTSLQF